MLFLFCLFTLFGCRFSCYILLDFLAREGVFFFNYCFFVAMAEGFDPYHVPQQSRRDKLRIVAQNHSACVESTAGSLSACSGLLPLYDASLFSSDLLSCVANASASHEFHHHTNQLSAPVSGKNSSLVCAGKAGVNSMGVGGGIVNGSSPASHHHPFLDAHSSLPVNPSSIQYMNNNNNPFHYTPQSLQNMSDFDQSYNGGPLSLNRESSATGQALSLSLSSHNTHRNNFPYGSATYSDKVTASGYVVPSIIDATASTSNGVSRGSLPLGPFTGYASILERSRFLRPSQQLLEELFDVVRGLHADRITADSSLMEPSILQSLNATGIIIDDPLNGGDGGESRRKKSRFISMLDEVYRSYKHYHQQIQAVVASFEYVAGLGNAAPFANLALKAMSKHFRCLKKAITEQLQFINKPQGQASPGKDEGPVFGRTERTFYNRAVHNFHEHRPVWRPQRGLPERAVTVLRAWLFEHFLHPYPTDTDKLMLAKQTGLSRNQVSNWFINARVRLWKPMVEEIHMLEQAQKGSQKEDRNSSKSSDHLCSANSLAPENPSTSTQRAQDMPLKRTRTESLSDIPLGSEPFNLSYNSLSSHPHVGIGVSMAGGSNGVSLTLGLRQDNGISLSEPFPMSAAQGFGLGLSSEGYVIGGFEAQNQHFGRDVIGGQLLHDFVG